jgi:eukaryotic-like serine/threonine-protein kinase
VLNAHTHDLEAGQRVGRYLIRERIGCGAMGVVYAARDPALDRTIAIKLLRLGRGGSEAVRARLLGEGQAMARVSHPGVAVVHDVGAVDDCLFLAMELVDGPDAGRWLRDERPPWRRALAPLCDAGRGLAAAHAAGLVHRDIKPANILVRRDGRACVADFGLAIAVSPEDRDASDSAGTPRYMAPEQHLGRPADARADQFSFCVLLYEAIYGEPPFAAVASPDVAPALALAAAVTAGRVRPPPKQSAVPRSLRRILLRGLSVDPDDRWPSMDALVDALDAERMPRSGRLGIAIAAAVMVIAAAAAMVWLRSMGDRGADTAVVAHHRGEP